MSRAPALRERQRARIHPQRGSWEEPSPRNHPGATLDSLHPPPSTETAPWSPSAQKHSSLLPGNPRQTRSDGGNISKLCLPSVSFLPIPLLVLCAPFNLLDLTVPRSLLSESLYLQMLVLATSISSSAWEILLSVPSPNSGHASPPLPASLMRHTRSPSTHTRCRIPKQEPQCP